MTQDVTVVMAFTTEQARNKLTEGRQVALISSIMDTINTGATLTEHMGGYIMDNGTYAIEYSYTIDMYGLNQEQVDKARELFVDLKNLNKQESIIFNGDFI